MSDEGDLFAVIRKTIAHRARANDAAGVAVAVTTGAAYFGGIAAFDALASPWRWIFLAVAAFLVGTLFIVGHDACHLALVRGARLNRLIGRLAFVPTLHPYTAWEIGHNRRHHGFTNLKGVDYVWCPWTRSEFDAAPFLARLLYRAYHTPLGIGLYYPIEIWWRRMWRDDDSKKSARDVAAIRVDRAFAAGGFVLLGAGSFALAFAARHSFATALLDAAASLAVPLVVFHYLMSVVIFIHHRHPSVVWRDDAERYTPFEGQVKGTVHATLPRVVEVAFLDILTHTAHHANARIPLYALAEAQRELRSSHPGAVTSVVLTLNHLLRTLRECQLYDFEESRWMSISTPDLH